MIYVDLGFYTMNKTVPIATAHNSVFLSVVQSHMEKLTGFITLCVTMIV